MELFLLIFIFSVMCAIAALELRDLIAAALALGASGFFFGILFALWMAPDLALLAELLMILGGLLSLIGALGIARFPDLYTRIQASTLCTLGVVAIAFGVMVANVFTPLFAKALLLIVFIFLTAPGASHAIGRAGYRWGVKLWGKSVDGRVRCF